ncbi:MAG TPA: hypothetical protein VFT22_43525 [Kofleriaceae bacterium]|nr:hypothetical protein [Kofleriaceae bacterium]
MKRLLKRIATGLAIVVVLGIASVALAVVIREDRVFEAPYPEIHASQDPAVIARGAYLATGPAHCIACHRDPQQRDTADPAMSGGGTHRLPVGTIWTPNITPDVATGIGKYSDRELARLLRYGVHPSGRAVLPFMPFNDLSDEDLTAVLSYLRSRPAVSHAVPANDFNLLGRFARAFLLQPTGPSQPIRSSVPRGPTATYGEYLANSVGNCVGCHTRRSLRTGELTGPRFGGGMEIQNDRGASYISPNLTPDPATGRITAWSEDAFVARFRNATATESPMPWLQFQRMTDDDLRALYRYLQALPPVELRPAS